MQSVLLFLIRFYQFSFSYFLGRNCCFEPSCSQYAKEAILAHGACRGVYFGFKRLLRCHPFSRGGYDPIP